EGPSPSSLTPFGPQASPSRASVNSSTSTTPTILPQDTGYHRTTFPEAALPNAKSHICTSSEPPKPDTVIYPATSSFPIHPLRPHIRTPSAAGLQLQTDLPMYTSTTGISYSPSNPTIVENSMGQDFRHSVTAPIPIQEGHLRSALSAASMASLSPGSALSSPALNALADITPLPSPLVMSDGSPGPWSRAGSMIRPGSAGGTKDDSFAMLSRGTLSPTPSVRRKGYHKLQSGSLEAVAVTRRASQKRSESGHGRNRSVSEVIPDIPHNVRHRQVTISGAPPATAAEMEVLTGPRLHREEYLAGQRGLISTHASGLPTPPASNRSVTESEEEEVMEDEGIEYIAVRYASEKPKKLWRPVRQLGQGTFSKVYLATSQKIPGKGPLEEASLDPKKLVAIKIVEHGPAGGADEERVELSLKREVEMLRSVSHPSLISLMTFDHDQHRALLVLPYCPGGDLFEVASAHRNLLTVDLVQRIFAELVGAVRHLHEQLIVHRDIKLESTCLSYAFMISQRSITVPQTYPYPIVTLGDLGLSRRIPAPPASPLLTTRCGSEDYAAPEILLGQPYDGRSTDAWALGVLLYALMESRLPFDPPPGKAGSRSRAAHRIARCDWVWVKFGDADGEWDAEKGKDWAGARQCVEGLLKKATRGRKSLEEIEKMEWVRQAIKVEGGLRKPESEGNEE
ncbi:kinase-like protein, partial [Delitschia confertaspora ATCC 74209]